MKEKVVITNSFEETYKLGIKLGLIIKEQQIVVVLEGSMASGKTSFTKGIAYGYGITSIVNSPTYTVLKKYVTPDKKNIFYHFDLYRLDDNGFDLDIEDYLHANACVVVEWPSKAEELLPTNYLNVAIEIIDENTRKFIFTSKNNYYSEVVNKL